MLRPGGTARIMLYHLDSVMVFLLWLRFGLLAGRPGRSLRDIVAHHLESPRTQAYTVEETRQLFHNYRSAVVTVGLSQGDLLVGEVGRHHGSRLLPLMQRIWPRWFITRFLKSYGCCVMIEARA